jgi:sigma-B regulation protein RsbU (phosphoserine phosphatase)
MKLLIIYIIKLIILIGTTYSIFQLNNYLHEKFFLEDNQFKTRDYLILITLFSLIGIIGELLQPGFETTIIGFGDLGPILAGILSGPLIGIGTGGAVGIYKSFLSNSGNDLIFIFKSLIIGGVAGFFKLKLSLKHEVNYKKLITTKIIPVIILYLILTINVIYRFNISSNLVTFMSFILTSFALLVILSLISKLRESNRVEQRKDRKLSTLNKSVKKLNGLHEMVQEVNSSTNIYQTFESVVKITCKALNVEAGGIFLLDENDGNLS